MKGLKETCHGINMKTVNAGLLKMPSFMHVSDLKRNWHLHTCDNEGFFFFLAPLFSFIYFVKD